MNPDSHRLVLIDAAVIVSISIAIFLASNKLIFMTILVPSIIMCRMVVLAMVAREEGVSMRAEVLFLALCTVLGAYNDWNSVCNKKIYEYTVPHFFRFSSIPVWMLIYWGMILRFIARLARWSALGPERQVSNVIGINGLRIDSPYTRIAAEVGIIAATRQAIYRFYLDPFLSWLPFFIALVVFFLFFDPRRHDLKLLCIAFMAGPAVEILYIKVGHLHHYYLGWIGGVPLWIVLWWLLAILIWKDLAFRIEKRMRAILSIGPLSE